MTILAEQSSLEIRVHWHGGELSTIETPRGRTGVHRHVADPDPIELIGELALEFSDSQIARVMHRRGLRTPKDLIFTASRVAVLRNSHGFPPGPRVPKGGKDIYTAEKAAELLGVTCSTVIRWGGRSGPCQRFPNLRRRPLANPHYRTGRATTLGRRRS